MASTSAVTASSSFAALLKQSKFASYSPAIAQVYVTHGGHATRGDWGVKRPLAARKRNKALMIQSMDSREQQTEFRSAEPEAKMVQRWEEVGMDVTPSDKGPETAWYHQYANRPVGDLPIDSEYCSFTTEKDVSAGPASALPALGVKTPPSIEATPNFYTMSKKEFDHYVERIRKLRPAFRRYVQERGSSRLGQEENEKTNLYKIRQMTSMDDLTHGFLNEMAHELHGSSESQALEPYPHRNGGLFYPTPNAFQTHLLYSSVPGRVTYRTGGGFNHITAAGVTGRVKMENNEDYTPLDWTRQSEARSEGSNHEHPQIRFLTTKLIKPPEVVTTNRLPATKLSYSAPAASILRHKNVDLTTPPFTYPGGLKSMTMEVDAATVRDQSARSNPYRPGSIPYSFSAPRRDPGKFRDGPKPPPALSHLATMGIYGDSKRQPKTRILDSLDKLLGAMDTAKEK